MESPGTKKQASGAGVGMSLARTLSMIETWEVYRPSLSEYILAFHNRSSVKGSWNFRETDIPEMVEIQCEVHFDRTYDTNGEICGTLCIEKSLQSPHIRSTGSEDIWGITTKESTEKERMENALLGANFIGAMIFRILVPISSMLNRDCEIEINLLKRYDPLHLRSEQIFALVDAIHEACEMLGMGQKRILIQFSTDLGLTDRGLEFFQELNSFYHKYKDTRRLRWIITLGKGRETKVKLANEAQVWKKSLCLLSEITRRIQRGNDPVPLSIINIVLGERTDVSNDDVRLLTTFIKSEGLMNEIAVKVSPGDYQNGMMEGKDFRERVDELKSLIPKEVSTFWPQQDIHEQRLVTASVKREGAFDNLAVRTEGEVIVDKLKTKTVILFVGSPLTGKTTSTQRLYLQMLNNYRVALLSTLSVRESLGLMEDLRSGEARGLVYKTITEQVDKRLKGDDEFIIVDGNFNKRFRREIIYKTVNKHNANMIVIECTVDREEAIRERLDFRKRHEENIQHKASSFDLYYLIKNDADPVDEDLLPSGGKPILIQYNTERQNLSLFSSSLLTRDELTIVEQVYRALLPRSGERDLLRKDLRVGMKENRIKAVIFDIGGVIQPLRWDIVANRIARIKPGLTMDQFRDAFYYQKEQFFGLYETAKISAIEFWTMVAGRTGVPIEHIGEMSDALTYLYSPVDEEMMDIILSLKNSYKLFTLSNSCLELERAVREYKDVYRCFDEMYFSHQMGCKKPSKSCYQYILEDNALAGEECIFIDDVARNITAAEELKIRGILFVSPQDLARKLKQYLGA